MLYALVVYSVRKCRLKENVFAESAMEDVLYEFKAGVGGNGSLII